MLNSKLRCLSLPEAKVKVKRRKKALRKRRIIQKSWFLGTAAVSRSPGNPLFADELFKTIM